jgi:hypothetical protein
MPRTIICGGGKQGDDLQLRFKEETDTEKIQRDMSAAQPFPAEGEDIPCGVLSRPAAAAGIDGRIGRPHKKQRVVSEAAASSSAAAASSSVSSTAAAIPASLRHSPQPHLKLHKHALESICGFLSFEELLQAVLVSPRWKDAVYAMAPLPVGRRIMSDEMVATVVALPSAPPLARHVSFIGNFCEHEAYSDLIEASRQQLLALLTNLPKVRKLCLIPLQPNVQAVWNGVRFPAMELLHSVAISYPLYAYTLEIAWSLNPLIQALSLLPSLSDLYVSSNRAAQIVDVSLAPLQTAQALRSLSLQNLYFDRERAALTHTSPAHAQELRALTQLERLDAEVDEPLLLEVLRLPSDAPLGWTELPSSYHIVTDAVAELLPRVTPRLRRFDLRHCSEKLNSLDFLARLPKLKEFTSRCVPLAAMPRHDALLQSLSVQLPLVTSCWLSDSKLTNEELEALMKRLPHLRELTLERHEGFTSLEFLMPLAGSLRTLCISRCKVLTPLTLARMSILPSLHHLEALQLHKSFVRVDTERGVHQLLAPLLPKTLKSFRYSHQ